MSESITTWLHSVENGRFDTFAGAFAANFGTVKDLAEVVNEIGPDEVLAALAVQSLTDRVKLKKAMQELLTSADTITTQSKTAVIPATSVEVDEEHAYAESISDQTANKFNEWANPEPIEATVATLNTALQHARYSCAPVIIEESGLQLVALVGREPCAPRQLSAGLWVAMKLQATLVPAAQADDIMPEVAKTAAKRPLLNFKPGYVPQLTTIYRVLPVQIAGATPSEQEVSKAVKELEELEAVIVSELSAATNVDDLLRGPTLLTSASASQPSSSPDSAGHPYESGIEMA